MDKVKTYTVPACQAISEHHFNNTDWPWTEDDAKWDEWTTDHNDHGFVMEHSSDARGFVIEHSLAFFMPNRYQEKWRELHT